MLSHLFLHTFFTSFNISACVYSPAWNHQWHLIPIRWKISKFLTVAGKVLHYFQLKQLPLSPSLLPFLPLHHSEPYYLHRLFPHWNILPRRGTADSLCSFRSQLTHFSLGTSLTTILKNNSLSNFYHIILPQSFKIITLVKLIAFLYLLNLFIWLARAYFHI